MNLQGMHSTQNTLPINSELLTGATDFIKSVVEMQ